MLPFSLLTSFLLSSLHFPFFFSTVIPSILIFFILRTVGMLAVTLPFTAFHRLSPWYCCYGCGGAPDLGATGRHRPRRRARKPLWNGLPAEVNSHRQLALTHPSCKEITADWTTAAKWRTDLSQQPDALMLGHLRGDRVGVGELVRRRDLEQRAPSGRVQPVLLVGQIAELCVTRMLNVSTLRSHKTPRLGRANVDLECRGEHLGDQPGHQLFRADRVDVLVVVAGVEVPPCRAWNSKSAHQLIQNTWRLVCRYLGCPGAACKGGWDGRHATRILGTRTVGSPVCLDHVRLGRYPLHPRLATTSPISQRQL